MPRHKKSDLLLYADECIPYPSVTFLRSKGISVKHVYEMKLIGKSDDFHFKNSKKLGRVLLSFDDDFKKIDPEKHPGIILISTTEKTYLQVNKLLKKMIKYVSLDFSHNSLILVSDKKIIKTKNNIVTKKNI